MEKEKDISLVFIYIVRQTHRIFLDIVTAVILAKKTKNESEECDLKIESIRKKFCKK